METQVRRDPIPQSKFSQSLRTLTAMILLAVPLSGCGVHTGWEVALRTVPINEIDHEQKLTPPREVFSNRKDD
jgi:hypothetical protein